MAKHHERAKELCRLVTEGSLTALQGVATFTRVMRDANPFEGRDDQYWLMRLMEEVGELAASLRDAHEHPPELELLEIASIATNWLERRAERAD